MEFFPFGVGESATGSTELLGGKGAGLLWMASEGIPVPPGFVIPTSVWAEYDKKPKSTMKAIAKALPTYLATLEAHFGYLPLLSVRSGARVSCPGMMDTILNVGIEASNVGEWTNRLGPACFANSFHRLVTMYGSVVAGIRREKLEPSLAVALDEFQAHTQSTFPGAADQLLNSIEAVFKSWDNDRANEYRKMHGYERGWGTAVTVQAMVFGNLNEQSGSGVLFTRHPDTGEAKVTGEWLPKAQGEDIVAGIRTPDALDTMKLWNSDVHDQLLDQVLQLEHLKKEMLDIEFTIQDAKLYLLQVRTGKRSAAAAIRIAVDMVNSGLVDAQTAVKRVTAKQFDLAQMATVDPSFTKAPAFTGIPACSGVVTGKPVFDRQSAIECKEPCILIRKETEPEDIMGMKAAVGVITMVGGFTSHAAIVARAMDRACIVGVGAEVDVFTGVQTVSFDGATGRIWTEKVPVVSGKSNGVLRAFTELVCGTLGNVVPVIFGVPTHPMKEAVLYLGDQILNPLKAGKTVLETLALVDRLYLDLMPTVAEQRYLNIVKGANHTGKVLNLLAHVLPVGHEHFSKLVLIVAPEYHAQFSQFERLNPGTVDLRTLVLADKVGEVVMDGIVDPAIQKVLAWKVAEGSVQVVSIGAYLPGSKSMLSVPQALHIVHGEA